ncbi:MAG: hypothetical protein Q9221_008459 [Calogaya cf. arnoldii]
MAITIDPEPVWDQPIDVPEKWIKSVGQKIKGIFPYGASYWTRTAEIQTEQADGTSRSFFLKVTKNEVGKAMVSGEYESMKALYSASPSLTPEPIAW